MKTLKNLSIKTTAIPVVLISAEWDVLDLLESMDRFEVMGYLDPALENQIEGISHLGGDESWSTLSRAYPDWKAVLAVDPPAIKQRLWNHYREENLITLISPYAYVSSRACIGPGSIIQRGVNIMPQVRTGKGCKFNLHATVHHEAVIGDFCTLAPQALVLGRVVLEDQVYVGAGAIIKQRCRIGKGATIGAGAVVVKDVPPGATVVGIPAKPF